MNVTLHSALSAFVACLLSCSTPGCDHGAAPNANADTLKPSGPRRVVLAPETLKRLGITTQKVGDANSQPVISVPGSIEYDLRYYAEIGPRLDGRVTSVRARLGDKVKAGDVLAEMTVPSLAEAQASALTAQASLAAAKKNAAREKDLLSKALTTARESEVAEADLLKNNAEFAAAQARLQALGVVSIAVGGGVRLTTPIDGVVVQRHAVLGGFLSMSSTAFVVANTDKLIANLEVHEADLPYLRIGSDTTFRADGLPDRTFRGTLTFLDPTVNRISRLVRARVNVDNASGALRPGMFVRATIALPNAPHGSGIPLASSAVQPLGPDDVAFVELSPGTYEIRKLQVGRRTSEIVEILEGVSKGDLVVMEGAFLLRGEAAKQ